MLSSKSDIYKSKFHKNKLIKIEILPFRTIFISSIKFLNHYIKPKTMNEKNRAVGNNIILLVMN